MLLYQLGRPASAMVQAINDLPTGVLHAIPYGLIAVVLFIATIYVFRGQKELEADSELRKNVDFSTTIAAEKSRFLNLVLPYLSTPLNIFANGVTLTEKSLTAEQHRAYAQNVEQLRLITEDLVRRIDSTKKVNPISSEPIWQVRPSVALKSKRFIIPTALLCVLLASFYGVVFGIADQSPNYINSALQLTATIIITWLLYAAVRNTMVLKGENSRLRALAAFLRIVDGRRTNILYTAQHAIQTPIINLQEIVPHIKDDEAREYVARGIQQCTKLLRAFELVMRLEISIIEQNRETSNLREVIGQAVQAILPKIQTKQVSLEMEGLDTMIAVKVEPYLMELVIRALLLNSVEASNEQGIINLTSQRHGDQIQLQVTDQGRGMSRMELDSVFQYYPNLYMHSTNMTTSNGPGLSLIVSRMIIHAFHGELSLESTQQKGTVATVLLPVGR